MSGCSRPAFSASAGTSTSVKLLIFGSAASVLVTSWAIAGPERLCRIIQTLIWGFPLIAPGIIDPQLLSCLMIVYGDCRFEATADMLMDSLRRCAAAIDPNDLDGIRALLIRAGQLEQAISDFDSTPDAVAAAERTTDAAAAAFLAACAQSQLELPMPRFGTEDALNHLRSALQSPGRFTHAPLSVKIPEGFEFYALFPEQYCHSAIQWSARNPGVDRNRAVLVIGIRSIGTSLSALVAATLKAAGWQTERFTVRPAGPPFARTVALPSAPVPNARHALIVDEGPGMSGSSLAAVAQALVESGFKPERISFLPGHDREPGPEASADIRRWWAAIPRHVTLLEKVRWNGLTLTESLAARSGGWSGAKTRLHDLEDLSGGLWRNKMYRSELEWPAVAVNFERLKYRCTNPRGASVLWKFAGLGAFWRGMENQAKVSFGRIGERVAQN
ncbi:MAG TPA: hypothetical protein VFC07_15490, partial [Verrucomicrobiae bacterium]|nr:hypothetical protein [Verrucomicrobiae bacterium]